ncbi:hypothetical protein MF271_22680 (plasmid) [Deinococcus sp. KNUC1210]|uniref:hypothetical protein n=1 Tax=Deinococcus sp. KNUC1210 TaxID=2917691 RepID=UPI001EEFBC3F|nr:hypothetical protein [Deinococcus sp. KNUC1210]ULH18272.1 hypothetical protein MF271_22680 [Deinococcus sp. KNUC1210]
MAEMLDTHLKADDGTEISAQLLDSYFDLFCYGMTIFPSTIRDPRGVFWTKIRETFTDIREGMRGTILAGLEDAELILWAEDQAQNNLLPDMVWAAGCSGGNQQALC